MSDGLRALLEGVIDYAGLYPPAQLPLGDAIGNYARYRQGPDAWMLGRFVIAAAKLGELDRHVGELFASGPPLIITALGRGGDSLETWNDGLRADAEAIAACRDRHRGRVVIDVFEARLPESALDSTSLRPFHEWIDAARGAVGQDVAVYFEAALLPFQLAILKKHGAGAKLRCGGQKITDFPSAPEVAAALFGCLGAGVPLKLTAGLHHPLPRPDPATGARMHGFVNVLVAAALATAGRIDEKGATDLLDDGDHGHFYFGEGVAWEGLAVAPDEARAARRDLVVSFGSCSFDEPRDDLRELGWLEAKQ